MEIDRLSALPDDLVIDILRRLDGTKEAMKTAVLSKQWRFLWKYLPCNSLSLIDSNYGDCDIEEIERFIAEAHAVVSRTKAPIKKLSVKFFYYERFDSDVDAWLDSAAKSRVEYVALSLPLLYGGYGYTLPQAVYSHSPLKELELSYCNLAPPAAAAVEWRSMTQLTILYAELTQQAIDGIIAGCPALRRLELHHCLGFHRLEIGGRSFRYLEVQSCHDDNSESMEISAPYMRELKAVADSSIRNLKLVDVSSLEKARLDFYYVSDEGKNSQELLEKLQRVRLLVLGHNWIEREVPSMMRDKGWRFPESRVEELEIDDAINAHNVSAVVAILESSPLLKKFIIRNDIHEKEGIKWDPTISADLNRELSHLKNVEIEINVHSKISGELSFILAQNLLKRAPILEKMVIRKELEHRIYGFHAAPDEFIKKCETLHTYPRSSGKAVVEFINIG